MTGSTAAARTVLSTAGVRLALHELGGAGGARTLLIAHATGFHGRAYAPLASRLRGFHAWAPDLRGHGDSSRPDHGRFNWEGLADDVAAVAEAIGAGAQTPSAPTAAGQLYAFGHSMGAAVMLLVEARRPGTFGAIYAFEPIVFPPEIPRETEGRSVWVEGTRRRRREFPSRADAFDNFKSKRPFADFTEESLHAYLEHGFHLLDGGALAIKMDPEDEARMYLMSPRHATWDHLPAVECPVVVASGKPEAMTPSGWTERIAARLPNARVEVFEELGHMGPFEDPDRVAAAVQRFFDGIEAARSATAGTRRR
ncbi:MAG TPA: alpha/beta hydrolase [Thermoanaerobaculia bacterium]|nr:alpha/beta hydrolase [Thermoanaerobaculia bacterium]